MLHERGGQRRTHGGQRFGDGQEPAALAHTNETHPSITITAAYPTTNHSIHPTNTHTNETKLFRNRASRTRRRTSCLRRTSTSCARRSASTRPRRTCAASSRRTSSASRTSAATAAAATSRGCRCAASARRRTRARARASRRRSRARRSREGLSGARGLRSCGKFRGEGTRQADRSVLPRVSRFPCFAAAQLVALCHLLFFFLPMMLV